MSKVDRLHEILRKCEGPLTRKWLKDTRQKFKPTKKQASKTQKDAGSKKAIKHSSKTGETVESAALETDVPISIVLATPNSGQVKLIAKGVSQSKCFAIGKEVGEDALLLVHAKMTALLSMGKAIKAWGFSRCSGIFVLEEPSEPDVTDSDVLAVFDRGKMRLLPDLRTWPSEKGPVSVANRVLQSIEGRRVHVFAKSDSSDWESIVGDDNWTVIEAEPQ